MKRALVNGELVPATVEAPARATCPDCGGVVELRSRQGTYFWRHVQLIRGDCSPEKAPPRWRRSLAK
jgi:hypothetical protein